MISSRIEQRHDLEECQREAEHSQVHQRESRSSHQDNHTANPNNQQHCERSRASFEIECIAVHDPRVAEPRRCSRFHQVRWNRAWRNTRRLESTKKWPTGSKPRLDGRDESTGRVDKEERASTGSRDESMVSVDEKNLDAKTETEKDPKTHRGLAATVLAGGNTRAL